MSPATQKPAETQQKSKKRKNFSLVCEDDDIEVNQILSSHDIIRDELALYTTLKGVINDQTCQLQFYKINSHHLPNLAKIAKMLFCVTASSVPSECVFSKAGELISKKRTRLNPELAEDLLILGLNRFD